MEVQKEETLVESSQKTPSQERLVARRRACVAVSLVLLSPLLLAGCRSNSENGNSVSQSRGGGGYYGGSRVNSGGSAGGETASSPRGGFGGFGRSFFGGGS